MLSEHFARNTADPAGMTPGRFAALVIIFWVLLLLTPILLAR